MSALPLFIVVAGIALLGCSAEPEPPPDNPTPSLLRVDPESLLVRSNATTLTLTGQGFVSGSRVRWNGADLASTFGSGTQLTAAVPADRLTTAGPAKLTVVNPAPGGGTSGELDLRILFPKPIMTLLNPSRAAAGATALPVVIDGEFFLPESRLTFEGADLPVTYVNAQRLTTTIPAFALAFGGVISIRVVNPAPGGGASAPTPFTIENPQPDITSLSPDVIDGDAGPVTITVFGTKILEGAAIWLNGTRLTTQFVAVGRLATELSASQLAAAGPGSFAVTVQNPAPAQGPSAAVSLQIAAAPPRIFSFSPTTVAAGSAGVVVNLVGANFGLGDQVRWNGSPRPTTFTSSTAVSVAIPATDLASPGPGALSVHSSATTRISVAQVFAVVPATPSQQSLFVVDQGARALVFDGVRNRLYAAVGAGAATRANTVVLIDPGNGTIVGSIPVPGDPVCLALSDDARYLYVGLGSSPSVARIDLVAGLRDLDIPLGQDSFFGPNYAEDLEVVPGSPKALVVSLYTKSSSPRHRGVAVFDETVPRPRRTQVHTGSNRITRGSSPSEFYGFNNETTEFGVRRLRVLAGGISEELVRESVFLGFNFDMVFDGGYLFSTGGSIVDAAKFLQVTSIPNPGLVSADVARGRVHYLAGTTLSTYHYLSGTLIAASDYPDASGAVAMVRFGVDGMAMATPTKIVLARSSVIGPVAER